MNGLKPIPIEILQMYSREIFGIYKDYNINLQSWEVGDICMA